MIKERMECRRVKESEEGRPAAEKMESEREMGVRRKELAVAVVAPCLSNLLCHL
jgi:hypothetical protein